MEDKCISPFCNSIKPNVHSPTSEEFCLFKSELDVRNWELLDKGQIKLGICRDCGAWTAEVWDQSEQQYMRQWACTPFRFDVGARVRVKLKGKYNGMVGTVTQRKRVIKKGYPLSAPENYYFILFGEDQNQKDFKEENLELHT